MASEKRKLKNSYCVKGALKNKTLKLKRVMFYTSSERKSKNYGREWHELLIEE